jgi:serine/threonine protein kinase/WD40 repeat protein
MVSRPFDCDPNRLRRLLDDRLDDRDQSAMAEHLGTCDECRRTLDALAAGSKWWSDARIFLGTPPTCDLGETPHSRKTEVEPGLLDFLASSDDPAHLGRLGPYEVVEVIGRGGMGLVLRAIDPALNRHVAIKVLAPELATSATARRRFAREGQAAAAISHDHIVAIYGVDGSGPLPYLVMQLVTGKSLQERIDQTGPLAVEEILRIGMQTASGLAAAHAVGLIHRDVKPSNILLENCVERVKITDFGLARAVDDASLTQSGVVAGTPQYMSPEQARGEAADHRADLFSLGSVLYALCTGRPPFRAETTMAVLRRVSDDTPRPIRELNAEIPIWLAAIVDRLHAKNPADRFASATEVADLLGRCIAYLREPTLMKPPFEIELPAPPKPRRRRFAMAAGVVALSLCALGASEATGVTKFVATVLRFKTADGTLVVKVSDPKVKVRLDGKDLVISGAGPEEIRVNAGQHYVQGLKDGKVVSETIVSIARGGEETVDVSVEPSPTPATAATPTPNPEATEIEIAEIDEKRASNRFDVAKRMIEKGYVSQAQFEAEQKALLKAQLEAANVRRKHQETQQAKSAELEKARAELDVANAVAARNKRHAARGFLSQEDRSESDLVKRRAEIVVEQKTAALGEKSASIARENADLKRRIDELTRQLDRTKRSDRADVPAHEPRNESDTRQIAAWKTLESHMRVVQVASKQLERAEAMFENGFIAKYQIQMYRDAAERAKLELKLVHENLREQISEQHLPASAGGYAEEQIKRKLEAEQRFVDDVTRGWKPDAKGLDIEALTRRVIELTSEFITAERGVQEIENGMNAQGDAKEREALKLKLQRAKDNLRGFKEERERLDRAVKAAAAHAAAEKVEIKRQKNDSKVGRDAPPTADPGAPARANHPDARPDPGVNHKEMRNRNINELEVLDRRLTEAVGNPSENEPMPTEEKRLQARITRMKSLSRSGDDPALKTAIKELNAVRARIAEPTRLAPPSRTPALPNPSIRIDIRPASTPSGSRISHPDARPAPSAEPQPAAAPAPVAPAAPSALPAPAQPPQVPLAPVPPRAPSEVPEPQVHPDSKLVSPISDEPEDAAEVGTAVFQVVVSPDGKTFATACDDGAVRIYDLASRKVVRELRETVTRMDLVHEPAGDQMITRAVPTIRNGPRVWAIAYRPDGKTLVAAGGSFDDHEHPAAISVWDVATGKVKTKLVGHEMTLLALAISPDGRHLVSGGFERTGRIWDLDASKMIKSFDAHVNQENGVAAAVRSIAWNPDGKSFATAGFDGKIKIWGHDGRAIETVDFATEDSGLNSVAYARDGKSLAACGGKTVYVLIWKGKGDRARKTFAFESRVLTVALSADGKSVAAGGGEYENVIELRTWNVESGRETHALAEPGACIESLVYTSDGKTLIVGGGVAHQPGFVTLWDLSETPTAPIATGLRR